MRRLFVLYDSERGLCTQLAGWLAAQPALIPLSPIPAQSPEAARLLPNAPIRELTAVGDRGEVWFGDRAWIMCLYALRDYRAWALKLAHPLLLPFARQAYAALSKHRFTISRFMDEQELVDRLRSVPAQQFPPVRGRRALSSREGFLSHTRIIASALTASLRVQHSANRNPSKSCNASASAVYQRNFLSRLTVTRCSFLSFSRWCESVDGAISSSDWISPTTSPSG
jgi:predicted DCC family thiol-disulfide oxidoreductase YuxK